MINSKANHSNKSHRNLIEKYKKLDKPKFHAINKVIRKFYAVPLEAQDLESIAWTTFLEVEEKYAKKKGRKSYENFFIDCLYWRAKDYCVKHSNNRHRIINHAITSSISKLDHNDGADESLLLTRLAIKNYVIENSNNDKGKIASLIMEDKTLISISEKLNWSRSKTYRVMRSVRVDLKRLLDL